MDIDILVALRETIDIVYLRLVILPYALAPLLYILALRVGVHAERR